MSVVLSAARSLIVSPSSREIIRCAVGEDVYCLEMSAVAGVKPSGDLLHRNGENFFPHQGQHVPVFDLANVFDQPSNPNGGDYTILVDHPGEMYGLRVDSVSRVIRLPERAVLPLPKILEHLGSRFRGVVDFTRNRQVFEEAYSECHLPGISEPKQTPSNRRRSAHQMQLLLNPNQLLPGFPSPSATEIAAEFLEMRYAAAIPQGQQGTHRQMVVFPLGEVSNRQLMMGLSISQIAEITEPLYMVSIPGSSAKIAGFVQWRECPVPVINLNAALDYEAPTDSMSHLIIVKDQRTGGLLALPVSGRVQSLRLPIKHRPIPLPDPSWAPFVLGSFEMEERLLILPRLEALYSN